MTLLCNSSGSNKEGNKEVSVSVLLGESVGVNVFFTIIVPTIICKTSSLYHYYFLATYVYVRT